MPFLFYKNFRSLKQSLKIDKNIVYIRYKKK